MMIKLWTDDISELIQYNPSGYYSKVHLTYNDPRMEMQIATDFIMHSTNFFMKLSTCI